MSFVPGSPGSSAHTSAARTFLRSLSIVLRYARLYGFDHARTVEQFDTTWNELRTAIAQQGLTGLLIGVSGEKLLIDGVPLEAGSGDRGFAQLLSSGGLASIHFTAGVTREDFERLVKAFMLPGGKASALALQIREATGPESGGTIRTNEVRFVPAGEDGEREPGMLAGAQIAALSLGDDAGSVESWFSNPQKLLQMIAAAQGAHSGNGGPSAGSGFGSGPGGPASSDGTDTVATEEEVLNVIRLFSQFGEARQRGDRGGQENVRQQINNLPVGSKHSLQEVLQALASKVNAQPHTPLLVQIAEHLAIRFALERYERGEVKVNAVRELLDRVNRELDSLRKVLQAHEQKLAKAGIAVESHLDILDREFWAAVPESGKQAVLLSDDAWCIPARNVVNYAEELDKRGDKALAHKILQNYANGVGNEDKEARRKTAIGLSQVAESYGKFPDVLRSSLTKLGERLSQEADPELQKLLSSSFTRLSQEAAAKHQLPALLEAMASLDVLEDSLPELARMMRPCIGVHDRLPEFVAQATTSSRVSPELVDVLKRVPEATLDRLLQRFATAARRDECERIFELAEQLGPGANEYLCDKFSTRPPAEAVLAVGMLSRLAPQFLSELLPGRLAHWARPQHDAVVRQIASAGAAGRGKLMLKLTDSLDPVLLPEVIDELGMSGEREAYSYLTGLISHAEPERSAFNRLKAIEALGRLRENRAEQQLQTIVESRHMFHWQHPRELRIAAAQALLMIDPARSRKLIESKGITPDDMAFGPLNPAATCPWARQRRYTRVVSAAPLAALVSTSRGRFARVNVNKLSLGGGFGEIEGRNQPSGEATIELQAGGKKVRAQVYAREADKNVSFEFVKMELDERSKLRRMLAEDLGRPPQPPGMFKQMVARASVL